MSLLLIAQTAEGGIISSLVAIFSPSVSRVNAGVLQGESEQTETNSQNIDLLEPVLGMIATSSPRAEAETVILDGSAVLSDDGPLGTVADIKESQPPSDLISVYTVRPGDTIEAIAKMYNVSANTIRSTNDLKKGSVLKLGENLIILPITGVQHVVKKGETIKGLAKKYGGNFEEIVAYNDLDLNKGLTIGDTIIIPDGEESTIVSSTKPGSKTPAKYNGPSYSGYFMKPVTNYRRTQGLHGYLHNAVDMAAPLGTSIYAAAEGKVIIAKTSGWNSGYGNYIVISHPNGTQTLYGHLSRVNVSVGERVSKGDNIAGMGSTGKSTGSHLHFEVRGAANPF